MHQSDDIIKLEIGCAAVAEALTASNITRRDRAIEMALTNLKPLSDPGLGIPKASFYIGLLAYHLAICTLNDLTIEQEERVRNAFELFGKAENYFKIAADMKEDGNFTPARSQDCLAKIYEDGVLGEKNLREAFFLRKQAARSGWAEAQYNLALMYYGGEGTEKSVFAAQYWLQQTSRNQTQLAPAVQNQLAADLAEMNGVIGFLKPARPRARPTSAAPLQAPHQGS